MYMNGLRGTFNLRSPMCLTAVLLAVMFLVGVTIGAFISGRTSESERETFKSAIVYSAEHSSENPLKTARTSFISVSAVGLFFWICGFFTAAITVVLCGTTFIYKGVAVGYTVGMLLHTYTFKGLCIAVFTILPQYVFFLPFVFYLAGRATVFELKRGNNKGLKEYIKLLLPLAAVCLISAFADAFVSGGILKLFSRTF